MGNAMRLLKLLLVLFVCAAGPVVAGSLDEVEAAIAKGDYATALRLYRPLAETGDASAQVGLGLLYHDGHGVPQNYAMAEKWFRRAASQGNYMGQYCLGILYWNGQGVPQDYLQAHMWLNLAASRSYNRATYDTAAKRRDRLATEMTPAQIAEAQKLAREWKPKPEQ